MLKEKIPVIVLLKMDITEKEVYIIVKDYLYYHNGEYSTDEDLEYFYNEHTCPSNYLRFPIIVDGDTDCHGIFKFIEAVPRPSDWSDHGSKERDPKKFFKHFYNKEIK